MLKITEVTCELWNVHTSEILAEGLEFEVAVEQMVVYEQFFGCEVAVILREHTRIVKHTTAKAEYKKAFVDYMGIIHESLH